MCVVCRAKHDKSRLIRLVLRADGVVFIDLKHNLPGRGAYVCRNEECISRARRRGCFERAFKSRIPPQVYDELLKEFSENE